MSIKLRELIRQVRSCKTAAEERSIISKECAHIRAFFKEDENQYRQRNIAKLLFIHMLGYPSQFGQVECLKLIASNKYCEKRIGYLALCQLLDEDSEILLLATNSIKNDLNHSNQYINGLALAAIANTAPKEMCRAVFREVCELLMVGNPFIKKRALLASVHIIRTLEDSEIESFINCIPSLLDDKHHGVLLGTCHLMSSIIQYHPESTESLKPFVPNLVKILNMISMAGYFNSVEYDSGGVTDQFLQVHILIVIGNLKSVIGDDIKENVCALLAQLLTNTDHSKNGGNSILYECVRTIIKLLPYVNEDGLYMLAVNTVTKFLQNTDLNIRFVALGLLENMKEFPNNINTFNIIQDSNSINSQESNHINGEEPRNKELAPHHILILDCLKDSDSSIKFRALKVVFSLINEKNIKHFVKDLLNILLISTESEDIDFSIELATGMCIAVRKCRSSNPQWFIDTYIKLFCLAGNIIKEEERDHFISYLASLNDSNIHSYTVKKLYLSLLNRVDQILLIQVTLWTIGEYSQYLFVNNEVVMNNRNYSIDSSDIIITESSVMDLIEFIINKNTKELNSFNYSLSLTNNNYISYVDYSNPIKGIGIYNSINSIETTINFALVAIIKSSTRLKTQKERIIQLLKSQINSTNVEIQQRSSEYLQIMNSNWDSNRKQILNPIPTFDLSNLSSVDSRSNSYNHITAHNSPAKNLNNNSNNMVTDLLDLDSSSNSNSNSKDDGSSNFFNVEVDKNISSNSHKQVDTSNIIDLFDNLIENQRISQVNNTNNNLINFDDNSNLTLNNHTTGGISIESLYNSNTHSNTKTSPFEDLLDFGKLDLRNNNSNDVETISIYENRDLRINFDIVKNKQDNGEVHFTAKYFNLTNSEISNFKLEVAVPKYLDIQLDMATSSTIQPNNISTPIKQLIRIKRIGNGKNQILMKLRINYVINNDQITEYANVNNIPSKY